MEIVEKISGKNKNLNRNYSMNEDSTACDNFQKMKMINSWHEKSTNGVIWRLIKPGNVKWEGQWNMRHLSILKYELMVVVRRGKVVNLFRSFNQH